MNYVLFLLLATFWGGSFVAIKMAVHVFPPFFSAMLRVAIALFFLILIFRGTGKPTDVPLAKRWRIWICGLFAQAFPFLFLFWGERYISAGLAGIINGTVSIWAFILGFIFFRSSQTYSFRKLLGLFLGIIGITIVFWPLLTFDYSPQYLMGTGLVLCMAISYAIGALLNQHMLCGENKVNFQANVYHQHWASLTFLTLASVTFETWPSWHTFIHAYAALSASLYMGLFSTAIAFIIYYHLIRAWDAVRASSVMYIAPIMAIFWDYVFFGTQPLWYEIFGVIAILSGVILIQFSRKK